MAEFGTSGLRGLAIELSDDLVAAYVAAHVAANPGVGIFYLGRDRRESSPRIAAAVARAASGAGCEVRDCGILPTPALALAATGALAVMVTGSHIPADRNGLKFYGPQGEITKADEAALLALVRVGQRTPSSAPVALPFDEARQAFIARYLQFWPGDALDGLKVGFWAQSSAARGVLGEVLEGLGAVVTVLGETDEFRAVDTEAVPDEVRTLLRGWARERVLHAIVSTDGDADRPLLTDGAGEVVPGDILGPIVARALRAEAVVTPVSSNTMIELMSGGPRVVRCRIGSPYVIAGMDEVGGRVIGYEPNGGVLLGYEVEKGGRRLAPLMTRDSVLPIVAVLSEAKKAGSVRALVDALPARRTATDRLKDVPREVGSGFSDALLAGDYALLPEDLGAPVAVDSTEGARMTFAGGEIVTVRPSGNAPELRAYVEAESDERARALLNEVLARLRAAL